MSEEVKNESTDTPVEETTKEIKKSWFGRVWSAIIGFIVGIAAMFGIDLYSVADKAQERFETYKTYAVELKQAIDSKDWNNVKVKAVAFSKELTKDIPADKLTGPSKKAYDYANQIIANVDAGKYDEAVHSISYIMKLFKGKGDSVTAPSPASVPAPVSEANSSTK